MYSIWCGLGYTFDSVIYEEIADSFQKNWASGISNPWLANKPPLTSIVILIVGIDQMVYFQLACFAIVIWISYKLCLNHIDNKVLKGLAILVTTSGLPVFMANSFLWSEPLFNVCVILLFFIFQQTSFSWKQWLIIIIISNVMILMRHAGLFILIGLFISWFLFMADRSKWRTYLIMLLLCCLGSIVWFLWAPASSGAWAKEISSVHLFDKISHNFYMLTFGFTSWFLPLSVPYWIRLTILGGMIIMLAIAVKKHKSLTKVHYIWIVAGLVYIGFLHGVYEMPIEDGERYFSPIFAIIFLVFFRILDFYIKTINDKKVNYIVLVIIAIWCVYPILRTVNNSVLWHDARCTRAVKSSSDLL